MHHNWRKRRLFDLSEKNHCDWVPAVEMAVIKRRVLVTCEYEVATAELSTIKVNRFMEGVKHGSTVHKAEID